MHDPADRTLHALRLSGAGPADVRVLESRSPRFHRRRVSRIAP